MMKQTNPENAIRRALVIVTAIVLSPIWIPLLVLWVVFYILFFYVLSSICIHLAVWLLWLPCGKHVLFVYSDSPIWHDYIEQHILPVIREQAVVLNWSQRRSRSWRYSLAVAAFKHFGGRYDFNPIAVVFRPFHRAQVFRFLPPFRDYKHGKPEKLLAMEQAFFEYSYPHSVRAKA